MIVARLFKIGITQVCTENSSESMSQFTQRIASLAVSEALEEDRTFGGHRNAWMNPVLGEVIFNKKTVTGRSPASK